MKRLRISADAAIASIYSLLFKLINAARNPYTFVTAPYAEKPHEEGGEHSCPRTVSGMLCRCVNSAETILARNILCKNLSTFFDDLINHMSDLKSLTSSSPHPDPERVVTRDVKDGGRGIKKYGMEISMEKRKVMVVGELGDIENHQINVILNGQKLKQVKSVTYLGSIVDESGKSEK
ncbi:hypothetical protein GQR58_006269 [Nymphon striatum]|nr:hypothetical protein GQR58_006269 [Nymphon striatum]